MDITDAQTLEVTRKLRQYISTFDNCYQTLDSFSYIGDSNISGAIQAVLPQIVSMTAKIASVLRTIESSNSYRDMVKHYTKKETV